VLKLIEIIELIGNIFWGIGFIISSLVEGAKLKEEIRRRKRKEKIQYAVNHARAMNKLGAYSASVPNAIQCFLWEDHGQGQTAIMKG
jgi:hypothetical protein